MSILPAARLGRPPVVGELTLVRAMRRSMTLAVVVAALACGGDSTSPDGLVASVTVSPATATIDIGGTATLQATVAGPGGTSLSGQRVFWNTENPAIATVSDNGVVTGVAAGGVRIAASVAGKSGLAIVTVRRAPVASVVVTPPLDTLIRGATVRLHATLRDARGNELAGRVVTWSSDKKGVADVDDSGLVQALKSGIARITATSEGKSGKATIVVIPPPTASLSVAPTMEVLVIGQTAQLTATARDASGAVIDDALVTWSSSPDAVATVSPTGLVRGVGSGIAIVTARSGTASAAAEIIVGSDR